MPVNLQELTEPVEDLVSQPVAASLKKIVKSLNNLDPTQESSDASEYRT